MRNFDINNQFNEIKKSAVAAVQTIFPIEGKARELLLDKVWVDDTINADDYLDQSKTKTRNGTWGVPIYADLILKDKKTGQVMDKASKVRLFLLPKPTDRFSYIVSGNEYQVSNQLRLKPGVYTLRKQNGELKTQVNLSKGKNFDIVFDEPTGKFSISKVGGGQSNIPLYPILAHLGISQPMISKTWGDKIASANASVDSAKSITRANAAFGIRTGELKDYFGKTQIDPDTTKLTLGKSFEKVDGEMLLSASKKLLEVHLGTKEPEDRDSLQFKELHSLEDFIKERLEKNKAALAWKIKRTIDNPKRNKITQMINPGAFNSTIESFFTQDDKSSTPEQTNPLEMLSSLQKVTIMGSGGITSEHAITDEMRNIHKSHFGFLDPIHTPESSRIGANLHLPIGTVKDGKVLKMVVRDKQGNTKTISADEASKSIIAFPGETGAKVKAYKDGIAVEVPKDKVDYYTTSPQSLFSWSTNLIPFLPSNQGNRAMMAAKQLEQAISLKHREGPLVQVGTSGDKTMEEVVGGLVAKHADEDGVIKSVDKDHMVIKTAGGDQKINLYNNFSLNRKSFLHHTPVVKVGDKVKKGDLLAESNYTKNGKLALGANFKTAYIPFGGYNFEDGIVITDKAAERLTSEHIYKKSVDIDDTTIMSLNTFRSQYPSALTPKNLAKLGSDGVIKKGETIQMGEAFAAVLKKRDPSAAIGVIKKQLADRPRDASEFWSFEDEGQVIDVQKSGKTITVLIRTEEQAKIGDKLSGRHGNKGIITKIIPHDEAPKNKAGDPVEVMLNPHGVISRINIGQIYESAASKVADKTKEPIVVQNFSGENYLDTTKALMDKHKIDDKEELFDAKTGKSLGKIHVGKPHLLKLFKLSTGNFSVRQGGPGHPYDVNQQPLRAGGEEGAKSLDLLTFYSMLSHGARANLRDMSSIKANQNDEFWKALKSGQQLPPPKAPFVYDKFMAYLKGAGIDAKKSGTTLTLAPLTDQEVTDMSSGEVKKPVFYRAKDMQPIKDGFYDPVKFGGLKGTKWGHIELKEPIVNPVFETAVKKITGLGSKLDGIMAGRTHYKDGKLNSDGKGLTGGKAIEKILSEIDVEKEIKDLEKKVDKAKGNQLDDINKKLRYLQALKKFNMTPDKAYMRKFVPVLPPKYRPLYPLADGNVTTSDLNFIYQNIGILNEMHNLPVMNMLPDDEKQFMREDMYNHVKGLSGLTDMNIKGRPRDGIISEIRGGAEGSPKEGFFIRKVLSKPQDFVGRGTIIPEPSLGVDEVAMPETMAWKLFEPFVTRELSKFGKTPNQALDEIKNKTELAKKALDIVMRERKVLLNRAPSLHKFSIMAFKPILTSGTAIKIPPLVVKGFNADFDGDTMTVHVPVTDEANQEANKMLPSRNLYQPGTGKLMMSPSQESQIGIYYLSKTQQGRATINKLLPKAHHIQNVLDKKQTAIMLTKLSKELTNTEFAKVLDLLKSEGEKHAYDRGFTLGMEDLVMMGKDRDRIVAVATGLANKSTPATIGAINTKVTAIIDKLLDRKLKNTNNPFFDMIASGAKGDPSQLRSILATPLFVQDSRGRVVPTPIKTSYSEGLDIADYWTSMYGARRGMMDRAIQTSLPGGFSKEIMATTIDNVISGNDCGTTKGITLPIDSKDVFDRYLAIAQYGVSRNQIMDQRTISQLKRGGAKTVIVRSPLTCEAPKGVCQKCFGLDEHGGHPEIGDNIGAKAGQSISEPLVQMTMNTFHTGGVAGTGADAVGYKRIDQLLKMPKIVPGAAPLSSIAGIISKIEKGIAGGFDVHIGEKKFHVPLGRNLKVKVGSEVERGDPLSDGSIKPQDLVMYKGMQPAQNYIVGELHKAYTSQGANLHRKVFETIVRSTSNTTQVLNNPKQTSFLPGDIIPYTVAIAHNKNLIAKMPTEGTVGLKLTKKIGEIPAGTELEEKHVKILKGLGHEEVEVEREPILHAPMLKTINQIPLLRKDWLAAMGFQNLAKALTEGAGHAWSTDLASHHPIPAFAYGASFGKGKEGKY